MSRYAQRTKQTNVDDAIINEFNAETKSLLDDLQGLQGLMGEQHTLLGTQGTYLDGAESNVDDAAYQVDQGIDNLEMAREQACTNRKLCIWLSVCCFILLLAVAVGLVIGGCLSKTGPFHDYAYCLYIRGVNTTKPTTNLPK